LIKIYEAAGISRQGYFQQKARDFFLTSKMQKLVFACELIRIEHPVIGCRKMYYMLSPAGIGRDRFEVFMLNNGFRVFYKPKFIKTTTPLRFSKYKNLLKDLKIDNINLVWVSDITYFIVCKTVYYIVFIKDVYSRMIVGYDAAKDMKAATIINALEMAFRKRGIKKYNNKLIHHSDKGTQYLSNIYEAALKKREVLLSVANTVYENPFAEIINRIIKKEYLEHWEIKNLKEMKQKLRKAVVSYNQKRPHGSLQKVTPMKYEENLLNLPLPNRKVMTFYTEEST
jgi:putative transposase